MILANTKSKVLMVEQKNEELHARILVKDVLFHLNFYRELGWLNLDISIEKRAGFVGSSARILRLSLYQHAVRHVSAEIGARQCARSSFVDVEVLQGRNSRKKALSIAVDVRKVAVSIVLSCRANEDRSSSAKAKAVVLGSNRNWTGQIDLGTNQLLESRHSDFAEMLGRSGSEEDHAEDCFHRFLVNFLLELFLVCC